MQEAIEHTKNKSGMKADVGGICASIVNGYGSVSNGDKFMLAQLQKHYYEAREAWLSGDIETVAEFFGLYV